VIGIRPSGGAVDATGGRIGSGVRGAGLAIAGVAIFVRL